MSGQQERTQQPFSEDALFEATTIGESLFANCLGRFQVNGITINDALIQACDTAIWLEKTAQGGYTLLISFVDVGSFITAHRTPVLDHEASIRAFAHYATENVFVPLFPASLAEGSLSLLEGQSCPTLTLSLPFDASFHMGEPSFQQTFVRSRKQFTYEDVDREIADTQAEFSLMFQDAFRLAVILWRTRLLNGAITLYDLETGWVTTEDGVRILLSEDKRYNAYIIKQEFLILANQTIASYLAARELPALYRNYQTTTTDGPTKATYAPTIEGHVGLHVPVYIHAILPLRAYPDLVNQRVLLAALRGEPSPYTLTELAAMALPLNTKEAIIKAAKAEHFRGEYDEQLQKRMEEEPFEFFDQKRFHSVIRKATEEKTLTPAIEQEIIRRLEHYLLKDNDLYTLVFRFQNSGEDWERIKQVVCYFLQNNPSYAGMLFNIGQQIGKWKLLHSDQKQDFRGYFQTKVSISCEGQEYTSSFHTALKKNQAKYRAFVDVLAAIAGIVLPAEVSALEQWEEEVPGEEIS